MKTISSPLAPHASERAKRTSRASVLALVIASGMAACTAPSASPPEADALGATEQALYQQPRVTYWPRVNPTIPLCWQTPGYDMEKGWVETAIQSTWATEAQINVVFEAQCPTALSSRRVRIAIGPHGDNSSGGGNAQATAGMAALTGPGSTGMNFWFKPDHTASRNRVEYLAVHEFGHVLGFSHEQDQASPEAIQCRMSLCAGSADVAACMAGADDAEGGIPVGPYDPNSIMNYCGDHGNWWGRLSSLDSIGVRKIYGKRVRAVDEDEPVVSVTSLNGTDVHVVGRSPSGSVFYVTRQGLGFGSMEEDIGGLVVGTPLVVAPTEDRTYVFARGTDNAVWYKSRSADGTWSPSQLGWESLGGYITARPAVAVTPGGRMDVFVRGWEGDLHHKAFYGDQWASSTWQPLGGLTNYAPAAVGVSRNRVDLYVVATDHSLARMASDDWGQFTPSTPWEGLGGYVTATPAVASSATGQVDIVVKGGDRGLYQKSWNGRAWIPSRADYRPLNRTIVGAPALINGGPGRLDLFAQSDEGQLLHTWAQASLVVWPPRAPLFGNGWDELGGTLYGTPAAVATANGVYDAFTRNGSDMLQDRPWNGREWAPWRGFVSRVSP